MHVASSTQSYTAGIGHALRFCLVQFMSECTSVGPVNGLAEIDVCQFGFLETLEPQL
jgi:hypothetical protein